MCNCTCVTDGKVFPSKAFHVGFGFFTMSFFILVVGGGNRGAYVIQFLGVYHAYSVVIIMI